MKAFPSVICPHCKTTEHMDQVLTAQSNQNVIYRCESRRVQLEKYTDQKRIADRRIVPSSVQIKNEKGHSNG